MMKIELEMGHLPLKGEAGVPPFPAPLLREAVSEAD